MSDHFELRVTRLIQASPEAVWKIYVERTGEWFCPRPWTTPVVDWDLRTGGRANVEMQSPEGERHAYSGVFLEVVPGRRLVSTGATTEGWVPQPGEMNFVRIDTFEPEGTPPATPPSPATGTKRRCRPTAPWASSRAGAPSPINWPNWPKPTAEENDHDLCKRLCDSR